GTTLETIFAAKCGAILDRLLPLGLDTRPVLGMNGREPAVSFRLGGSYPRDAAPALVDICPLARRGHAKDADRKQFSRVLEGARRWLAGFVRYLRLTNGRYDTGGEGFVFNAALQNAHLGANNGSPSGCI